MSIKESLTEVLKEVPPACTLIAVSKTQPIEKIMEAYACGQRAFGENRAQELAAKYESLPKDIQWHMIGHLQTNKVKYIATFIHLIHSVDSLKLLEEINRQGARCQRIIPCLVQVHIAEEETKFGFSPDEIFSLMNSLKEMDLRNIEIKGLMGMATFTHDEARIRKEFRTLKSLYLTLQGKPLPRNVEMAILSMGMSSDYRIAIDEGSTMIRVGTAIFGQ
jgi:PLP dependent protein